MFTGNRVATNQEVITQCNSNGGSSVQCRYAWTNNINRSCERVIATWTSAPTAWYQITTSSSSSSAPCVFTGNRVATAAEVIAACNTATTSSAMASSVQCRYGYLKGYNTSCTNVINNYAAGKGITNSITTSSGGSRQCCECTRTCAKIGTVSGGECKDVNNWGWVRSIWTMEWSEAWTFCSNLGMELKSKSPLQSAGLWNWGTNPFGGNMYAWTTDRHSSASGGCCYWAAYIGTAGARKCYKNRYWDDNQAFCGPK